MNKLGLSEHDAGQSMIKAFLNYIGLSGPDIKITGATNADMTASFAVIFSVPQSFQYSQTEVLDNYISSLRERLRNSEEVKRMVMDVEAELELRTQEVKDLKRQNEKLLTYKNYYDIEMKLRHGDKP